MLLHEEASSGFEVALYLLYFGSIYWYITCTFLDEQKLIFHTASRIRLFTAWEEREIVYNKREIII